MISAKSYTLACGTCLPVFIKFLPLVHINKFMIVVFPVGIFRQLLTK